MIRSRAWPLVATLSVCLLGCGPSAEPASPADASAPGSTPDEPAPAAVAPEPEGPGPASSEQAGGEGQAEVVPNLEARPGDRTTCPYSGRVFLVDADDPKVDYQGEAYWVCSEEAAEAVRGDPAKYLDDFEG